MEGVDWLDSLASTSLEKQFSPTMSLLRGAKGIEGALSSCRRWIFHSTQGDGKSERQVTACAYLPMSYLRLVLDKSLRITAWARG